MEIVIASIHLRWFGPQTSFLRSRPLKRLREPLQKMVSLVSKKLDVPAGEYVVGQSVFCLCVLLPYCSSLGISLNPLEIRHKKKWFWFRAVMGGTYYYGKILVFKHLPAGDASALVYTSPLWAGFFSRLILKEKYTPVNVLSAMIAVVGALLICKPSFIFHTADKNISWTWRLAALACGMVAGFSYAANRNVNKHARPELITVYLCVFELITAGLVYPTSILPNFILPTCYGDRWQIVVCGLSAAVGYVLLNKGLAEEKSTGTIVIAGEIALAYVLQVVWFSEVPEWQSIVGSVIIFIGILLVTLDVMFDLSCGIQL